MKKNCKNGFCLHNKNGKCSLKITKINDVGFCNSMIVLNEEVNHKIYKFDMGDNYVL